MTAASPPPMRRRTAIRRRTIRSSQGSIAPFTRAFLAYARNELGFATELSYELLNGDVSRHWEWGDGDSGGRHSLGASDALRRALALQPQMRVLIAHGLTDLTTPYMTSRYVVDHLPAQLTASRVELKLYPGGHMMYLRSAIAPSPARRRRGVLSAPRPGSSSVGLAGLVLGGLILEAGHEALQIVRPAPRAWRWRADRRRRHWMDRRR